MVKAFFWGLSIGVAGGIVLAYFYWAKAIALGEKLYAHAEYDWQKAENLLANFKRLIPGLGK